MTEHNINVTEATIKPKKIVSCIALYHGPGGQEHWETADTEDQAKAQMMEWLIEYEHVTLEKIACEKNGH